MFSRETCALDSNCDFPRKNRFLAQIVMFSKEKAHSRRGLGHFPTKNRSFGINRDFSNEKSHFLV
jgi:hypothetical protein